MKFRTITGSLYELKVADELEAPRATLTRISEHPPISERTLEPVMDPIHEIELTYWNIPEVGSCFWCQGWDDFSLRTTEIKEILT